MSLDTYKADFTDIYTAPDPRAYYRTLGPLDYQIAQNALPWVELLLARCTPQAGSRLDVVDLCCSYGINGLLLNYDFSVPELCGRYESEAIAQLGPEEVVRSDRELFTECRRRDNVRVLGLDVSAPAIDYAVQTGLLAEGWAEDLEADDPSAELAAGVRDAGLILCTGGIGYIGPDTFTRVLDQVERPGEVWLGIFALRQYDMTPFRDALSPYGLDLEQVRAGTVRQRRFASEREATEAVRDLASRGLDPQGRESEGWFYADFYVAHPRGGRVLA